MARSGSDEYQQLILAVRLQVAMLESCGTGETQILLLKMKTNMEEHLEVLETLKTNGDLRFS